jgi:hypothetical protein
LVRCYVWNIALYGSENWALGKLERKYLESFEMWCFRRLEKIKWSEKVIDEEVLERIGEKRINIMHTKANWIGQILKINCLFHDTIEGQVTEMKAVRRRRRAQLLNDLRNRRRYWNLKEEAEDTKRWKRQLITRT